MRLVGIHIACSTGSMGMVVESQNYQCQCYCAEKGSKRELDNLNIRDCFRHKPQVDRYTVFFLHGCRKIELLAYKTSSLFFKVWRCYVEKLNGIKVCLQLARLLALVTRETSCSVYRYVKNAIRRFFNEHDHLTFEVPFLSNMRFIMIKASNLYGHCYCMFDFW